MVLNKIIKFLFPLKIDQSSLGFKYPTHRNTPSQSAATWLAGKREDDNAEGLWRVHDNLYDLNEFVKDHPGGSTWLELTKGTDVTELFETHHLSDIAEKLLPEYFVRKSTTPRNSPFTFKDGDFYKTLKNRVVEIYPSLSKWPIRRSKLIADCLLALYLTLTFVATVTFNFKLGLVAGLVLYLTTVASHNFFHQRDNFRMYYFDFSLMSSRKWRVSHSMSHHMYTNTIRDLEIIQLEPYLQLLPNKKVWFVRYMSWAYSPIFYGALFFGAWSRDTLEVIQGKDGFSMARILPLLPPFAIYMLTGTSPVRIIVMCLWILLVGSFSFGVVGINAAHHHPDIFHDGDTPRAKDDMDWGVFQVDAVMDRNEITGSHFLVLTHFGDHALHHLFPTLDHGMLQFLYPVFKETCEQFGVKFRMTSQLDLICGQFRQLARVKRNAIPPSLGGKDR
ncbi:hypothetical protein PPYR_13809 [Photinus pyralis]|uniref:Cytochrome b5-related protein n=6 Tax=Photinus pyralis TaxID=7054 RepID=A0A1Y1N6L0_PHOPY|nr:cytochrome b5-related protein-like isoform X2 [Photinus pyralis]XP_031353350.1 cytochrome b5-related protein-like isoform X2 [Photinus pyralis]KAB0794189.1 hypothetical protein PPYR_13809 [Photinus pyralis]